MQTPAKPVLTAFTDVHAPLEKVWQLWTNPEDIVIWNAPSADWHTTKAENDVRAGGKFFFAMALKDGTDHFDFAGTYDEVKLNERITYTLDDGRKTIVTFTPGDEVRITESFEPVDNLPFDMQKDFCQSVLDRFKKYAASKI